MANSNKTGSQIPPSGGNENTPYVGPRPFTQADQDIFFGRNQEAIELTSLVKAHPEVLLYAQSGAGKTSLLFAQVIPILDAEEEFDVRPTARVRSQESSPISEDTIRNIYMFNAFKDLSDDKLSVNERAQLTLVEYLKRLPRPPVKSAGSSAAGPIEENPELRLPRVIIFDQFEEIFTLYPERYKDRQDFFTQVSAALEADQFLRVIFSMREDYIAELDPYVEILPQNLRTRFRLERLRKTNALSAVKQPLETDRVKARRQFAPGAAELLVDRLMLIKVKTASGEKIEVPGEFVDPVQLQVVCQTLWEKLPPEKTIITGDDLDKYANVDEALSNFYESCVRKAVASANSANQAAKPSDGAAITEGAVRGWFEQKLITREGKRNMVFREGAMTAGLSNVVVDELENQHVIRVEMRGGEPWYELSHDRFIPPIRESNRRFLLQQPLAKRKAQELEERADKWLKAGRNNSLLLNRVEWLDAKAWMDTEAAAAIGYSDKVVALIGASGAAIEHEDSKQQQMLAAAQRRRSRHLKIGFVVASGLLVLAISSTIYGFINGARAKEALAAATAARKKETIAADQERVQRTKAEETARELAIQNQNVKETARKLAIEKQRAEDAAGKLQKANAEEEVLRIKAEDARKRAEEGRALADSKKKEAVEAALRANAERDRAAQAAAEADSARLASVARLPLSTDPELSLRLALSAFEKYPTELAKSSLRQAYLRFKDRSILRGHKDIVRKALYSPDGRFIFTGSDDTTVKMWDAKTNQEVKTFTGHGGGIHALAINSEGTRIATEALDNTGRIWNVSDGTSLELKDLSGPVAAIAFSPNGKLIATEATSDKDKPGAAPRIWDVTTGVILQTLQGHSLAISGLAFNPKGNLLATASWDRTARIWDVATGRQLAILEGHTAPLASVAFSPDGALIVTGSYDGTARVWDTATGKERVRPLEGHKGVVRGVAFSPDGTLILTRGRQVRSVEEASNAEIPLPAGMKTDEEAPTDNTVRLWDVKTGLQVRELAGHTSDVNSATFSSDGALIVTASEDGTARVWVTATGESIAEIKPPGGKGQNGAVLSPDNRMLVTAGADQTAQVWRLETEAHFIAHRGIVLSAKFTPGDQSIVTSGSDGAIRRWDVTKGTSQPLSVELPKDYRSSAVISPDGKFVVTGSLLGNLKDFSGHVWDVESKTFVHELAGNKTPVTRVSYSPKGKYVVGFSRGGSVGVWETSAWKRIKTFGEEGTDFAETVLCASFSFDDRYLATGHANGKVRIWDVLAGTIIAEMNAHKGSVYSVAFNPDLDSPLIVSASSDATARVCAAMTGKCLFMLRGHTGPVYSAEFSRDGNYIVTVGADREIRVWEAEGGNPVADLTGYSQSLRTVSFNSDNTRIVAGGQSGMVFVSECEVCRPIEDVKELALKLNPRQLTPDEEEQYLYVK